jgi:hypothetical protein
VRDVDLTQTVHAEVARLAERVLDRFDTSPARGFSSRRSSPATTPIHSYGKDSQWGPTLRGSPSVEHSA